MSLFKTLYLTFVLKRARYHLDKWEKLINKINKSGKSIGAPKLDIKEILKSRFDL